MTASNMKLISSSVALLTLGPDFRYETRLIATGPIRDGVLEGDLVLVGSGDPTFGGREEDHPEAVLDAWSSRRCRSTASQRIDGRVLGDDDCQPDEVMGDGWAWNYQGADYAAQVSGLCFAENCVALTVTPAAAGRAPAVSLVPALDWFDVENRATCFDGKGRRALWADRKRATNRLVLGGRMPVGSKAWHEKLSVENPTAFAAKALADVLAKKGVEIGGAVLDRDDVEDRPEGHGDDTVLATHQSAPLRDIVHTLDKVSQNLYAEQVIRTASRVAAGDGSMRGASAHAKEVLAGLGIDTSGLRIADGSGLTRLNLVHPRHLAGLLAAMWRSECRDALFDALPVAGVDGTLRTRAKDSPAQGHVHAKTGYIGAVVALSGYVVRPKADEDPIVFSILVNNFTCRTADAKAAIDSFVEALCRHAGW